MAESTAEGSTDTDVYPFALAEPPVAGAALTVDTRPLIRAIASDRQRGLPPAVVARRFHTTLAAVVHETARVLRVRTGVGRVALSGGVFLNGILTPEIETRLAGDGFEVYCHRVVSPGDGELSLGQIAVRGEQDSR